MNEIVTHLVKLENGKYKKEFWEAFITETNNEFKYTSTLKVKLNAGWLTLERDFDNAESAVNWIDETLNSFVVLGKNI